MTEGYADTPIDTSHLSTSWRTYAVPGVRPRVSSFAGGWRKGDQLHAAAIDRHTGAVEYVACAGGNADLATFMQHHVLVSFGPEATINLVLDKRLDDDLQQLAEIEAEYGPDDGACAWIASGPDDVDDTPPDNPEGDRG